MKNKVFVLLFACLIFPLDFALAEPGLNEYKDTEFDSNLAINFEDVVKFQQRFDANSTLLLSRDLVVQNGIKSALRLSDTDRNTVFSHEVSTTIPFSKQNESGTCWMHANVGQVLHHAVKNGFNANDNHLSYSYWIFWESYERANDWLNRIINLIELDHDDINVYYLLNMKSGRSAGADSGVMTGFKNLINKYGAVPEILMPHTKAIDSSSSYKRELKHRLLDIYTSLKRDYKNGMTKKQLLHKKRKHLEMIFDVLEVHLGKPPMPHDKFKYAYIKKEANEDITSSTGRQKDKHDQIRKTNFEMFKGTPKDFYNQYLGFDFNEYVMLVHNEAKGYYKNTTYVDPDLKDMADGQPHEFINVDWDSFKKVIIDSIKSNEPVTFCGDLWNFDDENGVAGSHFINRDRLYGTKLQAIRAERLISRDLQPTHTMHIIAIHDPYDTGNPERYKIQNSWGETERFSGRKTKGHLGLSCMTGGNLS